MKFTDLNPVVDKKFLVLLAGLMWCGVGIMLVSFAVIWLSRFDKKSFYFAAGFIAALPIHHFGFLKIADKNLKRLLPLNEKKCIFSFMTWKSYLIVLIMVSIGITLRHSSVPKNYLSVIYIGIGLALFLSGIRYFRFFLKLSQKKTT
jgi:hypothetical protein